ncbi:PAS domain S-box-containing protein [Streptomyces sp. yr375]|uniref:SpoIIE family protein phosphatase n=1 Tax=Streptomyces sp. yr375 TaxID=1761906 RepID=UPI0008CDDBD0|nr:SpoIIE family protein phosphatase [Streptomyces sp. yr375]SES27303.1 PAS domain S-box-containing protein [Streptomyces sp. yr375]
MEGRRDTHDVDPPNSVDLSDDPLTARAVVDDHGMIAEWSEGARKLLGYPSAQVIGRPAADLLDEEISAAALRGLPALPRWSGTVRLRHQDGHRVTARLLAHHRQDEGSAPDWLLFSPLAGTAAHDEDAEKLPVWGFYQATCCSLETYDTNLRLRQANQFAERALNLSEAEMRGLRHAELAAHPEFARVEQRMAQVLETGEAQDVEVEVRVSGEIRKQAWSLSLFPLRNEKGVLRGVGLSAHDMTEQYWARTRLQLLNDAGTRIGTTLSVARTAQELADVAVPEFADFATVDLLPDVERAETPPPGAAMSGLTADGTFLLRRVAQQSVLPGVAEAVLRPGEVDSYAANSPTAECLVTGRPVLHAAFDPDSADWSVGHPGREESVRAFGIHSVMAVPLTARGHTLGVVVFLRHRRPESFSAGDLLLAEEITARAAVCIDNARRYARERETALALQTALLPQRLPAQPAVEAAFRYLPTDTLAGVGGDWFDLIPLSGARVALVVGDVVGHGVQASAIMGRLRTAVRTLADIDLPPDELLTHLDDLVIRLSADADADGAAWDQAAEMATGLGATCLYAVYDPVSRVCTLSRAGHPVPAVVSPAGDVSFLDVPAGPPLGLGGLPFETIEVTLPEGSLLALYSDGLVESRDQDIDEGTARLRNALAGPVASLDDLCDLVLATVPPKDPADDIALLVARTQALDPGDVATWELPADPAVVAGARKLVSAQLEAWHAQEASFATELVVSELVTNAIRHAEPPIRLRLLRGRHLICEVSDAGNTAPHLRRARTYDEGGRGLLLVAQVSRGWGTRHTNTGKTIWAELTLDPSESP